MKYTEDFKMKVLDVIIDPIAKSSIISGNLDIGQYLEENAYKGIDFKAILDCLYLHDYTILELLATNQEKLKLLYNEYLDYYSSPKLQLHKGDKTTLQ